MKATPCPACGHTPPAGARFCNRCGNALAAASSAGTGEAARTAGAPAAESVPAPATGTTGAGDGGPSAATLGWWMAGLLLVALIAVVVYPVLRRDPPPPAGAPGPAAGAGPGAVDLSSMSPREAADRLFNRVMTAASSGDSAQMLQFLPMAIQAYEMVGELDADGVYHLVMLQNTAGDFQAGLETARARLEEDPDHLLVLAAGAEAAVGAGDEEAARELFQRFLDVYDDEMAEGRPEYEAHSNILPEMRRQAVDATGG